MPREDYASLQPCCSLCCSVQLEVQNLWAWTCSSYLTEWKQHVIYDGVLSNGIPVLSGVPQGSVLGPLLFLIYIDDVTSEHLSQDSMLNLFADDMLLFKPVSDFHHLQDDIESIKNWTDSNHLSLNTKKCKCMLVSRKRGPRQLLSFKLAWWWCLGTSSNF